MEIEIVPFEGPSNAAKPLPLNTEWHHFEVFQTPFIFHYEVPEIGVETLTLTTQPGIWRARFLKAHDGHPLVTVMRMSEKGNLS